MFIKLNLGSPRHIVKFMECVGFYLCFLTTNFLAQDKVDCQTRRKLYAVSGTQLCLSVQFTKFLWVTCFCDQILLIGTID